MGRYPIPVPRYELRQIEGTLDTEKIFMEITDMKIGYSLPFTKSNADALYKDFVKDGEHASNFGVEVAGYKITVDDWKSWRDCDDPMVLHRFGHIPNSYEKQRYLDEQAGKIQPPARMYR